MWQEWRSEDCNCQMYPMKFCINWLVTTVLTFLELWIIITRKNYWDREHFTITHRLGTYPGNFQRNMCSIHNFRAWYCHMYSSTSSAMQQKMIVLAHTGSRCTKNFTELGGRVDFLRPFISSHVFDVISGRIQQMNSIKFCADLGKRVTDPGND
jgi:hypothetical protein